MDAQGGGSAPQELPCNSMREQSSQPGAGAGACCEELQADDDGGAGTCTEELAAGEQERGSAAPAAAGNHEGLDAESVPDLEDLADGGAPCNTAPALPPALLLARIIQDGADMDAACAVADPDVPEQAANR